jgi:hypothetical protein
MPILSVIETTDDRSRTNSHTGTDTDGREDKLTCLLLYLQSLEQNAEQIHGDNEDWRYGRYLFYSVISEAVQRADRKST